MDLPSAAWEYRFRFDDEHLLEHVRHHRLATRGSWILKWLGVPLLALVVLFSAWSMIVDAAAGRSLERGDIIRFLCFGAFAFLVWRSPAMEANQFKKAFRKSPERDDDVLLRVSDQGLHRSGKVGESSLLWDAYTRARLFPDGVLLYQASALTWLPDRALVSGSRNQLDELIRARIADCTNVHRGTTR